MMKLKVLKNKYFKRILTDEDFKCFKIILKHLYNKETKILFDPSNEGYIITNDITHYYLLISHDKIQLINTYDIVLLHIDSTVRNRVFYIIKKLLKKERENLKLIILDRKSNVLDKILINLKKPINKV